MIGDNQKVDLVGSIGLVGLVGMCIEESLFAEQMVGLVGLGVGTLRMCCSIQKLVLDPSMKLR